MITDEEIQKGMNTIKMTKRTVWLGILIYSVFFWLAFTAILIKILR